VKKLVPNSNIVVLKYQRKTPAEETHFVSWLAVLAQHYILPKHTSEVNGVAQRTVNYYVAHSEVCVTVSKMSYYVSTMILNCAYSYYPQVTHTPRVFSMPNNTKK